MILHGKYVKTVSVHIIKMQYPIWNQMIEERGKHVLDMPWAVHFSHISSQVTTARDMEEAQMSRTRNQSSALVLPPEMR